MGKIQSAGEETREEKKRVSEAQRRKERTAYAGVASGSFFKNQRERCVVYLARMPSKLKLTSLPQKPAGFIEPMDCLAVTKLPESANWVWEIKIDGYRAIAVKNGDRVNLYSRTRNSFNSKFNYIADALSDMPAGTVLDGELVGIDDDGRPNFNLLQNFRAGAHHIQYYVFDLLCLNNRDTTKLMLIERRNLFKMLSFKDRRIKIIDYIEAEPDELPGAVRELKLEGIVGKRKAAYTDPAHAVERGSNTV